jgi:hypothetical protein
MTDTYLKHTTVVVIAICSTIIAVIDSELAPAAMVLYGVIAGYVFKNGNNYLKEKSEFAAEAKKYEKAVMEGGKKKFMEEKKYGNGRTNNTNIEKRP